MLSSNLHNISLVNSNRKNKKLYSINISTKLARIHHIFFKYVVIHEINDAQWKKLQKFLTADTISDLKHFDKTVLTFNFWQAKEGVLKKSMQTHTPCTPPNDVSAHLQDSYPYHRPEFSKKYETSYTSYVRAPYQCLHKKYHNIIVFTINGLVNKNNGMSWRIFFS